MIGGTNYKGKILWAAEGQGANKTGALIVMSPVEPYNTTGTSPHAGFADRAAIC